MADRDDEPVQLGYETAEIGRRPPMRVTTAAIGASAAFVAAGLLAIVPGIHHPAQPAVLWPWVATGLAAGVMVMLIQVRVWRGQWQETRAAHWATVLLLLGLIVGMGDVLVMPVMNPVRDTSPRIKCASNMKQIGSAILLYSNENHNLYPTHLEDLLLTEDISADVFVCPCTNDGPATGPTTRAVADALTTGGHLSYVYLGAGLKNDCDADTVVLYEPLSNHAGNGMNVLFGDGHVEFIDAANARQITDRAASGERPVIWKPSRQ